MKKKEKSVPKARTINQVSQNQTSTLTKGSPGNGRTNPASPTNAMMVVYPTMRLLCHPAEDRNVADTGRSNNPNKTGANRVLEFPVINHK